MSQPTDVSTFNSIHYRILVIESVLEQGNLNEALAITKRVRKEIEEIQDRLIREAEERIKLGPRHDGPKAHDLYETD